MERRKCANWITGSAVKLWGRKWQKRDAGDPAGARRIEGRRGESRGTKGGCNRPPPDIQGKREMNGAKVQRCRDEDRIAV